MKTTKTIAKVKKFIAQYGGTYETFANAIGIKPGTFKFYMSHGFPAKWVAVVDSYIADQDAPVSASTGVNADWVNEDASFGFNVIKDVYYSTLPKRTKQVLIAALI